MINWEAQTVRFIRETSRWDKEKDIADILPAAIVLLRELTEAYLALRLEIEDDYTAKIKDASPSFFNDFILSPEPVRAYLAANTGISFWPDISMQQSKVFADLFPALSSAVIMPVHTNGNEIIIILGWSEPQVCDTPFRHFIEIVTARVKGILWRKQLETRLHEEVSLLSGMLQAMPQAVIFISNDGKSGWVNTKAASMLHIAYAGPQSSALLSQAMGKLRDSALNKEKLEQEAASIFTGADSVVNKWIWAFEDGHKVVSTMPVNEGPVKGRLWIFDTLA